MVKRSILIPSHTFLAVIATALLSSGSAFAESCLATQTAVTLEAAKTAPADATAPSTSAPPALDAGVATAPATAINTQDINLEKSFMQDGDSERAQYSTRDGDPVGRELFISATVDTRTGDATLIIRDLRSGLSANAAGAFGNDGVIATSLSGIVGGIQKLITVTCQR